MRSRWPVLVALLLIGLAVAGRFASQPLAERWSERQERQATANFLRDNPAVEHIHRLSVPEGLVVCPAIKGLPSGGEGIPAGECWTGDIPVREASAATRRVLTAAGASHVTEDCRTLMKLKRPFVVCRIDAVLVGQPMSASILPRIVGGHPLLGAPTSPEAPSAQDPQDGASSPPRVAWTWDGSQVSISIFPETIPGLPIHAS